MSDIVRSLVYRVSVSGQSDFARDLKTVTDLVRKQQTEEIALEKATALGKRKVRSEEAQHKAALYRTQFALEKARAKESVREYERAEKAKTQSATRAEKEKTRAVQREDRERRRAEQAAARESIRTKLDETRAFEKAEREKTRIAQRELRARQREEESISRATMRAQEATARHIMSQRAALARSADRDARTQARDRMFDHKRLYRGIGGGIAEGAAGALRTGYSAASSIARSIGGGLGAFAAFDVQDIVAERAQAQALMRSAAIEAREAGSGMGAFDEVAGYAKVRSTSKKFGISQRDLLGAIDAASEKGSGADAVKNIERIATQAMAMGTDATTVAKMRAQLKMSSKEAGKELNDDKIDTMMAQMHFIGKTGVFRSEDIAKEGESLVSSFVKGGGDLESGWKRYMTFSNAARKATGSGSMARTAIMGIQDAIAKKEGRINSLGIKTRNDDDSRRDMMEVIMDVITKTGGKGDAYLKIFDPSKSGKATSILETAFNSSGKTEAERRKNGRAAMEAVLAGDKSLDNVSVAEMNKDAELRMDTAGSRIQKAVETIRQSLADHLAPILDKIAANAPAWAEKIGTLLKWVGDNPMKAAGLAVAGNAIVGGMKGGALPLGASALRFFGDTLANKYPGFGAGKAIGGAASAIGGSLASMGAQPVYVTGAAPGVFGGGGGGFPGGGLGGAGAGVGGMEAGGAAMGMAGAFGSVIAPILGGALVGYLGASAVADMVDKKGPYDPKSPGQKAAESITTQQGATIGKLGGADADPDERQLLADMLGKGKNDPMVESLVQKVGDGPASKSVTSSLVGKADLLGQGQPKNALIDAVSGPAATGTTAIKDSISASTNMDRMVDATGKVADKLERLDGVLARLGGGGTGSAFKPPGTK